MEQARVVRRFSGCIAGRGESGSCGRAQLAWGSAYENLEKDYHENAVTGENVVMFDSTKNIVHTKGDKLVLLQGLNDFIVVDTADALLVCKKENEQNIKEYLSEIKRNKGDKYL